MDACSSFLVFLPVQLTHTPLSSLFISTLSFTHYVQPPPPACMTFALLILMNESSPCVFLPPIGKHQPDDDAVSAGVCKREWASLVEIPNLPAGPLTQVRERRDDDL